MRSSGRCGISRPEKSLARSRARGDQELETKRAELEALEAKLAQGELDLATLKAELHAFEARYLRAVGTLYWELDEIEARIAEANARLHPDKVEVQHRAAEARARARETAEAVGKAKERREAEEFRPSEDLKQLYREVAKRIHPDLSPDDDDRARRNDMMAEANRAYEEGDAERLRAILTEWETSPESIRGDDLDARIERLTRKIERAKARLAGIRDEKAELLQSDLWVLKRKVEKAAEMGRDLISEMARRVRESIEAAEKRLRQVTQQSGSDE